MEELMRSEVQFRLLSDSMPQFVWTGDVTGKLNYFSKAVYDFSGLMLDELVNDGWLNMVHPADREKTTTRWAASVAAGEEFIIEHRIKHHTGEYRWHLSRSLPQKGSKGDIQRWVGTSTDIQGHKDLSRKLEQQVNERTLELKELNNHLVIKNNIFAEAEENALIGTYSWHLKTGEMEYSDNLFRLFGYEPGEFVPGLENQLSLVHPGDIEQVKKDGEETMATKKMIAHTYRIITKQDKVKYFRLTGKFMGEDENEILIGTVQDISQDKLYNEILQAKNLELETSNIELESFNYIASHDLQEPLRKIQAFSQRIVSNEEHALTTSAKGYFNRIQAAAARMQNLIDALLSYSHTSSYGSAAENIDLNILVQDVVEELPDVIDEKSAEVKFETLPTLKIIPIQVQQLFINLITNAVKYSRDGVAPEINITATITDGKDIPENNVDTSISYWKISVYDNGIGFEQQYEHKIFELFQRLHGNTDYIGTGIGLAICKKIMRNHHGAISAVGVPGSGATFNMYFPLVIV